MLIYEKFVEGIRHLFAAENNIPSENDTQLSYKDSEGKDIEVTLDDSYVDGGSSNNIQRIKRLSDDLQVNVFAGDICIIGEETSHTDDTDEPANPDPDPDPNPDPDPDAG